MILFILATGNAGAERLRMMRGHFTNENPQAPLSILIAVLAIFAIFLIMKVVHRIEMRRFDVSTKVQPMSLYWRVQARLGLTLLDRWRLWRLAKAAKAHNPTALLISPALFDRAVDCHCGSSVRAAQFAGIRKRLFGQAAPLPLESVRPQ